MSRCGEEERLERVASQALTALDRRAFLRLSALAAASIAGPGGCRGVPAEMHPPPSLQLAHLSPRAYATFNAAAMSLLGAGAAEQVGARQIDPARSADAWLTSQPDLVEPMSLALWVLEFAIHPLLPKWHSFTRLDAPSRDRVVSDLMLSRLDFKRDIFKGLKSSVCLAFYSHPASRQLTGFPGPFGGAIGGIEAAMHYDLDS